LTDIKKQLASLERRTSGQLKNILSELIDEINSHTQYENYLDDFLYHVEQTQGNFAESIQKKIQLTEKQKVICYSIRTGMSLKDTAELMGTSTYAVKKARGRICKHFGYSRYNDFKQFLYKI